MAHDSRQAARNRFASSRLHLVIFFVLVTAVIDRGHLQSINPGPSGFTRIARDLGRKFCSTECEDQTPVMTR
jgi:hypothetical protein